MKKLVLLLALAGVGACVAAYLMFTGPRMKVQPNIRAFQARMPLPPAGAVPVVDVIPPVPSTQAAEGLANPLLARGSAVEADYARGRTYYGYYCQFCHGPAGRGDGTVGQSLVPAPTDFRSPRVRSLSDGQILRGMFTGTHAPMLRRIVPEEFQWYVVLHVRRLAAATQPAGQ